MVYSSESLSLAALKQVVHVEDPMALDAVTVRGQHNHLINPAHPEFEGVEVSNPEPLDLEPRLAGR